MSKDRLAGVVARISGQSPKWCAYCRKSDHSDAECWCTRAGPILPAAPMHIFITDCGDGSCTRCDRCLVRSCLPVHLKEFKGPA